MKYSELEKVLEALRKDPQLHTYLTTKAALESGLPRGDDSAISEDLQESDGLRQSLENIILLLKKSRIKYSHDTSNEGNILQWTLNAAFVQDLKEKGITQLCDVSVQSNEAYAASDQGLAQAQLLKQHIIGFRKQLLLALAKTQTPDPDSFKMSKFFKQMAKDPSSFGKQMEEEEQKLLAQFVTEVISVNIELKNPTSK